MKLRDWRAELFVRGVCAKYGTNMKEVRSRCKMRNLVAARKEISRALFLEFGYRKAIIARYLHRTHGTIVYHIHGRIQ